MYFKSGVSIWFYWVYSQYIYYIYPHVHNWATVSFKLYLNYTKLRFHKIIAKLDNWKSCEIEDAYVKLKCHFIKGFGPIVIILYPIILFHLLYLVLIDTNKLYLTTTSCNFREIESCICKTYIQLHKRLWPHCDNIVSSNNIFPFCCI